MLLEVSKKFSPVVSSRPLGRPILTTPPTYRGFGTNFIAPNYAKRFFWNWFKRFPELVSTISIPITDIIGGRPNFVDTNGKPLGRNKRMRADNFWRDNRMKEVIRAFLFDAFLTGEGFLWKASASSKEVQQAIECVMKEKGLKFDKLQVKETADMLLKEDEEFYNTRRVDYIASSSITILNNQYEVLGYKQLNNGRMEMFDLDEIIHFRYITINGEVAGYSPCISLITELTLLDLVKGNMSAMLRNGGNPDKAFILSKETAGSKNHEALTEALRSYKNIENWHGNMVFTGEVDIKDIDTTENDLEYRELALYITSTFAFAFGIPVSRIPYLIGSAASKGDSGGLAEKGYWNRISDLQDTIEDLLNTQLFGAMGFHVKFNRAYKHDEVREAQTNSMNADTLAKIQSILGGLGKQLTIEKTMEYLEICDDDIEDAPEIELDANGNSMSGQNQLNGRQMHSESDNLKKADTKKNSANARGTGAAAVNP